MPGAPTLVDQSPEFGEEVGNAVDLVENDKAILVSAQEQARIREPGAVGPGLKVQVERIGVLGNPQRQRRLPHLTRT